jgi:hypothetical protein
MSQLNVNNITKYTGGEVVVNDASEDVDFRVESDGNANMLTVNAGSNIVGVAADPDLGVGLHIKSADSGASVSVHADELVVEGSANSGLTILSGTSSNGRIMFGDSGDNDIGYIEYDHGSNLMALGTNAASSLKINSAGSLILPQSGQGIYLGVTSATAANLLDDYEEGTWTPALGNFSGSAESFIDPRYTKIGRMVFCSFQLQIGSFPSDGSSFLITGLPFTVLDGAGTTFGAVPFMSTRANMFGLTAGGNNTQMEMYSLTDGAGGQFNYNDYGQSENFSTCFFYEAD